MTESEIVAMEPGREMDLAIARDVMKHKIVFVKALEGYELDPKTGWCDKPCIVSVPCIEEHGVVAYEDFRPNSVFVLDRVPFYSSEIEATIDMVEKVCRENSWGFSLHFMPEDDTGSLVYVAEIGPCRSPGCKTPSEALCKAVLLASVQGVRSGDKGAAE